MQEMINEGQKALVELRELQKVVNTLIDRVRVHEETIRGIIAHVEEMKRATQGRGGME